MKISAIGKWGEDGFIPAAFFVTRSAALASLDEVSTDVEDFDVYETPLQTRTRFLVWASDSGRPSDGRAFVVNEQHPLFDEGVVGCLRPWTNRGGPRQSGYGGSFSAPSAKEARAAVRAAVRQASEVHPD